LADAVPIFEQSKLTLRLTVTKGETPEKSVDFILFVDGKEHSRHTATLQGTAFTWSPTAPKIDDAKVKQWPYELTYKVDHGGDIHEGAETWQVWPKTLELGPEGHDTPVQLKLLQQDKPIKAPPRVAKDKTAQVVLQRPEPVKIRAAFPWKVKAEDAIESAQGRKLTVELEKILFRVQFDKIDDGTFEELPIQQLVNLKSEKDKAEIGLDHKGPVIALPIKIKGTVETIDAEKLAESAGMTVYVRATFGEKTKRNDPGHPRKLDASAVKTSGDEQKGTVELDKNGTATCLLHLPLSGGETCKVEIGTTDQYGDDDRYFVTWRQLHFQISHPAALSKPDPFLFVDSYNEIKVELLEEPVGAIAAGSGPAGAWIDGNEIKAGFGRQALVIGTHNEKDFHKLSFKNKNDSLYAHFLICDFQYDSGPLSSYAFTLQAKHLSGSNLGVTIRGLEDPKAKSHPCALPTSLKDGTAALRKVSWSIPKKGKSGEIPLANCTIDYASNVWERGKLSCPLPADVMTAFTAGEKVTITFRIQLAKGPYLGSATSNLILIAAYASAPKAIPEESLNKTMVHELGHALGMCAAEITIPGIPDVRKEHGRSYTDRGHQGSHCAKGISDADYNNKKKELKGLAGTCVIFGEGAPTITRFFCDLCRKLLLPAALDKYLLEKL
jgi:hypothetical protein